MKKLNDFLIFLFVSIVSVSVYAGGGGGHETHIKDLIPMVFNFSFLVILVNWKFKANIQSYFKSYSSEIKGVYEDALARSKQAQLKYEMFADKIKNIDHDIEKIKKENEEQIRVFEKNYQQEMEKKIKDIGVENQRKLVKEENQMVAGLYYELVGNLVDGTKERISKESGMNEQVTSSLVGEIKV